MLIDLSRTIYLAELYIPELYWTKNIFYKSSLFVQKTIFSNKTLLCVYKDNLGKYSQNLRFFILVHHSLKMIREKISKGMFSQKYPWFSYKIIYKNMWDEQNEGLQYFPVNKSKFLDRMAKNVINQLFSENFYEPPVF